MTRAGKCDTCRLRKVKCDELKPKCTACRTRDRNCTYSFGKVSAFVVEDPTQLSKHGKAKVPPIIYPLNVEEDSTSTLTPSSESSCTSPSTILRKFTRRDTDDGNGVFMTLAMRSQERPGRIQKVSSQQRRRLQIHLDQLLRGTSPTMPKQFVGAHTSLAARYLSLLGDRSLEEQPFAILGSWIESIPSRIGKSPAVDHAIEYLVDSFSQHQAPSFSGRRKALASKSSALRELQVFVANETTRATYDTILAMKLHFIAEIFMGMKSLGHAVHGAGLSDILQSGPVSGLDEDHYWSFFDHTYIDDISEALVSGRTSVYDNPLYLQITNPAAIPSDSPVGFRASVVMMHCLIQLPRLGCLIRHATSYPEDLRTLASAIRLGESLWTLVPVDLMEQVFESCVTFFKTSPAPSIADIVRKSYQFSSVQSCIQINRFWQLQISLCALIDALYEHFPIQCAASLLPSLPDVRQTDIDAAMHLAYSHHYANNFCPSLPLLPLRYNNNFQLSIGTWYRLRQRTLDAMAVDGSNSSLNEQLARAQRMENWVVEVTNNAQEAWGLQRIAKKFLRDVISVMSGGPIPDWLPLRINFGCEDGEMVMKLEYDIGGKLYKELMADTDIEHWVRRTKTLSPFRAETNDWVPRKGYPTRTKPLPMSELRELFFE